MTDYIVIYEKAGDGSWHARAADLPVYAVGDTRDEAEREVRSAIEFHLETLRMRGEPVPAIQSEVGTVSV